MHHLSLSLAFPCPTIDDGSAFGEFCFQEHFKVLILTFKVLNSLGAGLLPPILFPHLPLKPSSLYSFLQRQPEWKLDVFSLDCALLLEFLPPYGLPDTYFTFF